MLAGSIPHVDGACIIAYSCQYFDIVVYVCEITAFVNF